MARNENFNELANTPFNQNYVIFVAIDSCANMKQPIQKIYIDTSVVGGYFDAEFSDASKQFFERIRKREIIVIISSLLEDELIDAPKNSVN